MLSLRSIFSRLNELLDRYSEWRNSEKMLRKLSMTDWVIACYL
jgi:hypothetical protein